MKRYIFEQFASTRLYSGVIGYSPDGSELAYADNSTGQFNLWKMPSGGGIPFQLTSFTDNTVRDFAWSPDGSQILLQADHDGDEQHQLYLISNRGGWPEKLTDADAQHHFGDWMKDGKMIAYAANDENPADMTVILHNLETGERERVLSGGGMNIAVAFSPDQKYLLAVRLNGNTDQDIFLINMETKEARNVTEHEGEIIHFPSHWAKDSSGFYLQSNKDQEFMGVGFYSLEKGTWDWVYTPNYDVEGGALSKDGKKIVYVVNENGASKLRGFDVENDKPLNLPDLPLGVISNPSINPDGTKMAFVFARPSEANNLYEVDLQTGEMTKLGQSMLGGIDPDDLVEPELITYTTFDGKEIPAWLYKPTNGREPFPMMLSIHGGPEAQERAMYNYNGLYQYLVNRGIGVLAPNIRGSTGYGKTYQSLIHRDWGGDELKDIEHAAKYLQSLEWVDNNRLAVFGGSFGGFATLSAITRLPEYWATAVDVVGPSNLITFAKSVPPHWKPVMKKWVGDPEEDAEMLLERSPITYVDNIRAPLLVIQGAKDPRVVQAESDQMVEKIRENGGDVTYYVDEHEGHGTTKRENSIKWFKMVAEYLEDQLMDD